MRWLVTLLLLVLVALGGLWLVVGERALTAVKLKKSEPDTASSPSVTALGPTLQTDSVRKVEITPTDAPTLTLAKTADGWTQPGNWPVREGVVNALVFHLTGLRTLFAVIPLANDGAYLNGLAAALGTPVFSWPEAELSQFGLTPGQLAVKVKLDIGTESSGKSLTLRFGQHGPTAGETKFSAPTYVRVDDHAEVLKLAPDVYATVARPAEVYRRRQLVPDADRAKVSGGENTARTSLLGDRYSTIAFERTDDKPMSYTLRRTAPTPEPRRDAPMRGCWSSPGRKTPPASRPRCAIASTPPSCGRPSP